MMAADPREGLAMVAKLGHDTSNEPTCDLSDGEASLSPHKKIVGQPPAGDEVGRRAA
jgi:hypothetical protein